MTFVKVCGLKNEEAIDWAIELGYDAIGLMLHAKSSRAIDFNLALRLAKYARKKIKTVAVGITFNEIKKLETEVDYIQVYEKCESSKLIFAGTEFPSDIESNYFLYDSSRGSGESKRFPEFEPKMLAKLILAGGLTVQNVRATIEKYHPFGVDVSSGVESVKGKKDFELMQRFIAEVRDAK